MNEPFDLIVIGGGVNGAGVARDAAGRGARVLLLEAGDLASGTSSKSTKLVHGGLRYLEYREFGLVREALHERETLWKIAPHIVWPMRFVLPVTKGMRPAWMLRAGLALYDGLAGRSALPGASSIRLGEHPAGLHLLGAAKGFEYSDCWVDDARLVVLNAVDAARCGAVIRPRTPVASARRADGLWQVSAGEETFAGRALVNAAGPGADDVLKLAGAEPAFFIRRVRGSHIVVERRLEHQFGYILQLPDTRIVFVLPFAQGFTLIGTTDADHSGPLDDVQPSEEEIAYLVAAHNRYFDLPVARSDVRHAFAGVRALVEERQASGKLRPEAATRGYRVVLSDPAEGAPLLTIYGGKITSYRAVAEEAVDQLSPLLEAMGGRPWTADKPLPGGDFPKEAAGHLVEELRREYPFLSDFDALRIARAYGLDAVHWLGGARQRETLGRDFGCGLSEAELDYLRRKEWAASAEDVLWRRTKLGLRLDSTEQAAVAEWMRQ